MFCNNCGKNIPDGATFCPFCGAEQPKINEEEKQKALKSLKNKNIIGSTQKKRIISRVGKHKKVIIIAFVVFCVIVFASLGGKYLYKKSLKPILKNNVSFYYSQDKNIDILYNLSDEDSMADLKSSIKSDHNYYVEIGKAFGFKKVSMDCYFDDMKLDRVELDSEEFEKNSYENHLNKIADYCDYRFTKRDQFFKHIPDKVHKKNKNYDSEDQIFYTKSNIYIVEGNNISSESKDKATISILILPFSKKTLNNCLDKIIKDDGFFDIDYDYEHNKPIS